MLNEREIIDALTIHKLSLKLALVEDGENVLKEKKIAFQRTYQHSYHGTLIELRKRRPNIDEEIKISSPKEVYDSMVAQVL